MLFVDPGIGVTGYAIYRHTALKGRDNRTLLSSGIVEPLKGDKEILVRSQSIAQQLHFIAGNNSIHKFYVEQPPQTVYGGVRLTKNAIIARAQSVFKTFAVTYNVIGLLGKSYRCGVILPVQWEPSKKQRGGMAIKAWSLQNANSIIEKIGKPKVLATKKDENEADAISIGSVVLDKLESGEWKW